MITFIVVAASIKSKLVTGVAVNNKGISSISSTIGAVNLRDAVIKASRNDEVKSNLDVNGVSWLEHINLVVGCKSTAEQFYQDFLGLSRDRDATFHVNLGQQQFHLAEGQPAHKINGSVGLVVPNLDKIKEIVEKANELFKETQFCILEMNESTMTVTCPWGNTIHLYCMSKEKLTPTSKSNQKMVQLHSENGIYSADRIAVRGKPGIKFVEFA